jgi:hypothetical protein
MIPAEQRSCSGRKIATTGEQEIRRPQRMYSTRDLRKIQLDYENDEREGAESLFEMYEE